MQICFFEDEVSQHFQPLTLTRPVDDLRIGIYTIAEKWKHALNLDQCSRILRPELCGVFPNGSINDTSSCTWINSRYLPDDNLIAKIKNLSEGQCLQHDQTIIAARVDSDTSQSWLSANQPNFNNLFVLECADFTSISRLWDLFQYNGSEIKNDLNRSSIDKHPNNSISPQAILQNKDNIYISKGATIEAGSKLIATDGPIYVGEDATIMAGANIRGPVAVCKHATIKMGANIYGGTTIGPVCKAGGEVSNSILHSYSNKAHDGYMGNSLIGKWCNIAADTITSNLKNNYGTIKLTSWKDEKEIKTGQQFIGTIMGDHSKTAIDTHLNTGTVCGVSCNIFSNDFPPTFIPSFSWVGANVMQTYKLDKAFNAIEAMMARRNKLLTEDNRKLLTRIFNHSR